MAHLRLGSRADVELLDAGAEDAGHLLEWAADEVEAGRCRPGERAHRLPQRQHQCRQSASCPGGRSEPGRCSPGRSSPGSSWIQDPIGYPSSAKLLTELTIKPPPAPARGLQASIETLWWLCAGP